MTDPLKHVAANKGPDRCEISMNGYIPTVLRPDKFGGGGGGAGVGGAAAADGVLATAERMLPEDRQKDEEGVRLQNTRDLRRVFDRIDTNSDGYLDEREVEAYLIRLGYTPQRGEVAKLIWEIDDDADGCVTWPEFKKTHERLVNYNFQSAKVAYEPRGFFNMIEFSMLDNDGSGAVDATEVITMFYRRYGRVGAMKKLDGLVEQGSLDDNINFLDFLAHDTKMRQQSRRKMQSEYKDRRQKEVPVRHSVKGRPI